MAAAALAAAKRNAGGGAQVHAQNSPTRSGTDSENDDPVPGFPYVTEGFWKYQKEAQRFYYRTDIQVFVAVLIGLNFLTNVWNAQVFPPEAQIMLAAYGASSPNDMVTSYVDDDEVAFTDVSTDSPVKVSEALWREKYQESSETWFILFGILGTVYNVCFFIELLINMYANWLCAFWIDGHSISEIARRERIDRQILRAALIGILNTLRAEADRNISKTNPESKPQPWPGLPPRRSAGH